MVYLNYKWGDRDEKETVYFIYNIKYLNFCKGQRENSCSKEEIELQLAREKFEFDKKLAIEKEKRERYRDNLLNTVIIGGIGYGGYRIGRHHHWW